MTEAVVDASERFAAGPLASRLRTGEPIGPFTTYRVGGPAALFISVDSLDEMDVVADAASASGVETLVLGRGSNLLVSDDGFDGLVVMLGEGFAHIDVDGTAVRAGGSARLPLVARTATAAGLVGFEWAVGVPGSVGGAVRMNAGGHGSDIAASLVVAEVVDLARGGRRSWTPEELGLGYRQSRLESSDVVVEATFELAFGDVEESKATLAEIVSWRRENQPGGRNAGSVFANPAGDSAGRLIEAAGAKGLRIGTAAVSDKHANFIQADENGRAADVWAVMQEVHRLVQETSGVDLRVETRVVGFRTGGRS